ncbi:MAG: RluA family pseudouridine synthase [Deltaproteobacteria bacterium]|nr:MAG: RluA family pseudouridine synthase [Deltaproteobacteria bacterium]
MPVYRDVTVVVSKNDEGKRLDSFLREKFPDASRGTIRKAFLERAILINGREARKGEMVKEGDRVTVLRLQSRADVRYWPNFIYGPKVIYKDDRVAALYKPPFMHTLPAHYGEKDTLANYAAYMFASDLDDEFLTPPRFLSRLDYETSGLVLMARDDETLAFLKEKQDAGEIVKTYVFLTTKPVSGSVTVTNKIVTTGGARVKVSKREHFEDPVYHTAFEVDSIYDGVTLVRATIKKGRMHQIRAHAAFAGFPILGDVKYGGDVLDVMKELPLRPLLHSYQVEFPHPSGKIRMKVNCPYPEDLYRVLQHFQTLSDKPR